MAAQPTDAQTSANLSNATPGVLTPLSRTLPSQGISVDNISPLVFVPSSLATTIASTVSIDPNNISPTTIVRQSYVVPLETTGTAGVSFGATITTYYKKRWRDSGAPTPIYVTYVTSTLAQAYPFVPPFGGPLVDEVVVDTWQL